VKTLIADDHEIVLDGIEKVLADTGKFQVVAKAADGLEALALARRIRPELVILDLSMPKMSGPDVAVEIKKTLPKTLILMLTAYNSGRLLMNAVESGINGIALKEAGNVELLTAINSVVQGKPFFSKNLASSIHDLINKNEGNYRTSTLSSREQQILKLIAEGNTTKEVARLLDISPKTVDNHRSNIMIKVGARNAMQLCAYAHNIGLVGNHPLT
jgi:two-component system, NarL family, response regulator NreC